MRPDPNPAPIRVEDQRGAVQTPETPLEIVARGARQNWRSGGVLGVLGLAALAPTREITVRRFRAPDYQVPVASFRRAPR